MRRQYFSIVKNSILKTQKSFRSLFNSSNRIKKYRTVKLIGYSCDEIYSVAADIQHYDQFVPFCMKSTIQESQPNKFYSNLEIGFSPIFEKYSSVVYLQPPYLVQAISKDGNILDHLESIWVFNSGLKSNPQSCIVDYSIRFSFKSILYSRVANLFLDKLTREMEIAFMNEVKRRFGKPSMVSYKLNSNIF